MDKDKQKKFRVRLPTFLIDEDIGLGDVIKKATSTFGVKPCGHCEQRAAFLNRQIIFYSWYSR